MSILTETNREYIIFYAKQNEVYKKVMALAKAEGLSTLDIDITKVELKGTLLLEIASRLGVSLAKMIKKESPYYGKEFCEDDWIKIIQKNPKDLKLPIAIKGNKGVFIEVYTDILKLA